MISSWIQDLAKDPSYNQSVFNTDYLQSQILTD